MDIVLFILAGGGAFAMAILFVLWYTILRKL